MTDKPSPLADIAVSNSKTSGAYIRIPSAPITAPQLMGKIIEAVNSFETGVLKRLKVADASAHGRRILTWLYQAGAAGITPRELETRLGNANTLRTNIHALRKNAAPIVFENGVYKLAQI